MDTPERSYLRHLQLQSLLTLSAEAIQDAPGPRVYDRIEVAIAMRQELTTQDAPGPRIYDRIEVAIAMRQELTE